MRVELFDPAAVVELTRFLRGRGFVVVRRGGLLLDVHPANHVSARHDRLVVQAAVREWLADGGCVLLDRSDARVAPDVPLRLRRAA